MVQEDKLITLASQVSEELALLGKGVNEPRRGGSAPRWEHVIPIELRVGRAVALISELSTALDSLLEPLIDEWLIKGGSVTKLSQLTGVSRPTLTRRKNRLIRRSDENEGGEHSARGK